MKSIAQSRQTTRARHWLASVSLAVAVVAPFSQFKPAHADPAVDANQTDRLYDGRFNCGYDPQGATDEWTNHRLNALRLSKQDSVAHIAAQGTRATSASVEDVGDIAVVEDDGTIVIPPNTFNLKGRSLLLTPDKDGYRISRADIQFNSEFGDRLGYFYGADGNPGNADNGYRDINLSGARFPFFGVYYDTIYIGTNGYITFTRGDTTARISPSALASQLPRIAPLWADINAHDSGDIYYRRFDGGHVITWNGVAQRSYTGISTFQAVLYDDGRIAFVYKKVKIRAALVGISPGRWARDPRPIDFSDPPAETITGPFFETFAKQKRIDLPALLQNFYRTHSDRFDTAYVWTDFDYDNGLGIAHSFNVRNDISGIGLRIFDYGLAYGSAARLSTIITMGNEADWLSDPQAHAVGLNSALSIVCHEQGHRWLAYVHFDAERRNKDDLLGRENAHWSFLVDTRTSAEGTFSSLMEGNSWRDGGFNTFATFESAVNYFSPLDQYLMGLRSADEVGEIPYLVTDPQMTAALREKSPFSGFGITASRKTISVAQIVAHEGARTPDVAIAPKEFRAAFIVLTERGSRPSQDALKKVARYRDSLVDYFSIATERRGSLSASLKE